MKRPLEKRTTKRSQRSLEYDDPTLSGPHAIVPSTPTHDVPVTNGSMAVADWLRARKLATRRPRWFAEIVLDVVDRVPDQLWSGVADSRFHLYLYPTEWSWFFCHAGRSSWVRVGDRPTVHGRDDFGLVSSTPSLADIGAFLRSLETKHHVHFRRDHALVRTSLRDAEPSIRAWLEGM